MASNYSSLCSEKLKEPLLAMRVDDKYRFRTAPPSAAACAIAAASVSVGDWVQVQVDGDRSPGWISEGGITMVIAVNDYFSDVKCVMSSCL